MLELTVKRGGDSYMAQLLEVFASDYMRWILYLVIADWLVGVVTSLVKKDFRLSMVAHYMHDAVLPFVLVFAVVQLVAAANPDLAFLVPLSFVLVAANLAGNILANLNRLGMPAPKFLRK